MSTYSAAANAMFFFLHLGKPALPFHRTLNHVLGQLSIQVFYCCGILRLTKALSENIIKKLRKLEPCCV